METWTGLIIGLVGSLHCAGMCGPLALALPVTGHTTSALILGRVTYNFGRIATYGLLGGAIGLVGHTVALAGFQRWLSLIAGTAILLTLAASPRFALAKPAVATVVRLKAAFATLLQRRSLASLFLLGALNGLLPCGLVYAACVAAAAAGGLLAGLGYMLAFGLGTLPMMLGIGLAGSRFHAVARWRLHRLVPACLVALGLLLILRGMALGIPYLSPDLAADGHGAHAACH